MHSCTEPNVQCSVPGTTIYVLPYYIHNDSPSWCLICHIIIVIRNPIILSLSYTILASPTASMLSSSCMFKTVPIFSDVSSALFSFASLSSPWFSNTISLFLSLSLVPWELTAWFNFLDNWWICQSLLGTKNWQTPLRHRTAWIQHQLHSQCKMSNLKGPWEWEGKASSNALTMNAQKSVQWHIRQIERWSSSCFQRHVEPCHVGAFPFWRPANGHFAWKIDRLVKTDAKNKSTDLNWSHLSMSCTQKGSNGSICWQLLRIVNK